MSFYYKRSHLKAIKCLSIGISMLTFSAYASKNINQQTEPSGEQPKIERVGTLPLSETDNKQRAAVSGGIEVWPPLHAPHVPTAIAVSVGETSDFRAALT